MMPSERDWFPQNPRDLSSLGYLRRPGDCSLSRSRWPRMAFHDGSWVPRPPVLMDTNCPCLNWVTTILPSYKTYLTICQLAWLRKSQPTWKPNRILIIIFSWQMKKSICCYLNCILWKPDCFQLFYPASTYSVEVLVSVVFLLSILCFFDNGSLTSC